MEELNKLEKMGAWEVVEKRKGTKIIGSRWCFAIKKDPNTDAVTNNKAQFVARGFSQQPGINYNQTYAPTASIMSLKALLAIAVSLDWKRNMFDVSSAYLNSDINEEIHVKAPEEINEKYKGKMLRLRKALYGMKEAGRCWWQHFER